MVEQDLSDQEQIAFLSLEASKKATEEGARAENLRTLARNRKEAEQKVADEHGKKCLQDLDDEEDAAYEEKKLISLNLTMITF